MTSPISWLSPAMMQAPMQALAWALIHFVWQGAAIAALAAILMRCCRAPSARYCVGLGALALMLAMPLVTLLLFDGAPSLALPMGGFAALLSHAALRDHLPWVVEFWLGGVVLLSLRFAGGFLLLEQKRRQQSTAPAPNVLALCRAVQQRLGVHRAIHYLECGWLKVPAVIGFVRPVILLPVAALTGLNEAQLRAVIAHELAHVRRWDFLVNLCQILAETLLFYHPAIWWLNRRISAERELCCDEIAVAEAGDRNEYARALVQMVKLGSAPGYAMAATNGILSERIFHILGRPGRKPGIAGLAGSLILLTASLAMAAVLTLPAVPGVHKNVQVASSAPPQQEFVAAPVITTRPDGDDYVMPRRVVRIRTIRPSQISFIPSPILIAAVDLPPAPDDPPAVPVPETNAPPHARSIVAEELDAQPMQYPAPRLKLDASHAMGEWTQGEAINYCRDFAVQTVAQGANQPLSVDDGVKKRLEFFNWHCLISNATGEIRAYGDGWGRSPAYIAVGAASSDHPINVSGSWKISLPSSPDFWTQAAMRLEARSCVFNQSGNTISGTCTGRFGSGAITGVIDGRQVRWAWKFPLDDGREGEFDFIGMVGTDGAMTGESINTDHDRPETFTATPGPAQVALQK